MQQDTSPKTDTRQRKLLHSTSSLVKVANKKKKKRKRKGAKRRAQLRSEIEKEGGNETFLTNRFQRRQPKILLQRKGILAEESSEKIETST